MLVDLDGLAANIKRALKANDPTGMAHMVDELVKYTKKLQYDLERQQCAFVVIRTVAGLPREHPSGHQADLADEIKRLKELENRWKCQTCGCEFPHEAGDEEVEECTPCVTTKIQARFMADIEGQLVAKQNEIDELLIMFSRQLEELQHCRLSDRPRGHDMRIPSQD